MATAAPAATAAAAVAPPLRPFHIYSRSPSLLSFRRRLGPAFRAGPPLALASALAREVQPEGFPPVEREGGWESGSENPEMPANPFKLYVCNLPRSCDAAELTELFKPYGTVLSAEVSRDPLTGISRGCGHVEMGTRAEAISAITDLDGSNLGGREMRVRFSAQMVLGSTRSVTRRKDIIYESRHKIYVGNLAWSVRPDDLRKHFSKFGTVVSTKITVDRTSARSRVYGFLSFSSAEEAQAALAENQSVFHSRNLLVRIVTTGTEDFETSV